MQVSRLDPFVATFQNSLSSDLCQRIIERFEQDDEKRPGVTGGGYTPEVKQSTDLLISGFEHWSDIDQEVFQCLERDILLYMNHIAE